MNYIAAVLVLFSFMWNSGIAEESNWKQVIPVTAANLKGHKNLYQNGWFVVTSTTSAIEYASKKTENAGDAINRVLNSLPKNLQNYQNNIEKGLSGSGKATSKIYKRGTQTSKEMIKSAIKLSKKQLQFSSQSFANAWKSFTLGHMELGKRTSKDRQALQQKLRNFSPSLKKDFEETDKTIHSLIQLIGGISAPEYSKHFATAKDEAQKGYKESGDKNNSATGLGTLLLGYFRAGYHFIFPPTIETAQYAINSALSYILSPTAKTVVAGSKVFYTLGSSLYYTTKIGIKVISPTIESGYLTGLAILSSGGAGVTTIAGGTIGLVNQVATVAVAPATGAANLILATTYSTAKFATLTGFDITKGTVESATNLGLAGVVLGYNALTAIPTHLLLGATNSAIFLAWDGPRLGLYAIRSTKADFSSLKSGMILNLQKAKEELTPEIIKISDNPDVIHNVIRGATRD